MLLDLHKGKKPSRSETCRDIAIGHILALSCLGLFSVAVVNYGAQWCERVREHKAHLAGLPLGEDL